MKILIVDDSSHKIDELSRFINSKSPQSKIDTAESISNAIDVISGNPHIYNLIIIDQYLPLRNGEEASPFGGKQLLLEIKRKLHRKVPNYIVGFSQYEDSFTEFSHIWRVVKYEPSNKIWQLAISELVEHINNNNFNKENEDVLPTVFVEGLTDKFYLEKAIEHFFPDKKEKLIVKSQKKAGSNWVINQIVAWAHGMYTDENGEYIKCIGLLDRDDSGNNARKELNKKVFTENQKDTFKCLALEASYNPFILQFYKKGVQIEIDIESLFNIDIWNQAEKLLYLEARPNSNIIQAKGWNSLESSLIDHILSCEIDKSSLVYLKKVHISNKDKFSALVEKDIYNNLINFRPLIEKIFHELKI